MSNFAKSSPVILFLCFFCWTVQAQTPVLVGPRSPRPDESLAESQRRQEAELNRQRREMDALVNSSRIYYPRTEPKIKPPSKEERARIASILAPDAADAERYKDFLRQKNTGLFRLFPDFDCERKNIIRVDGVCANLVPGSWNYSFRREDYSDDDFSDVKFKNGNLIGDGFLTQGIFVRLGDVPLQSVSAASGGIKFLLDFEPEVQSEKAKIQFARITKGVEAAGYKYANSVKVEENTTYALRTIAYRVQNKTIFRLSRQTNADDLKFFTLKGDRRVDLTVAFRVVRRDDAPGGITILWKELDRRNAREIVFAKNERPSDIKPVR